MSTPTIQSQVKRQIEFYFSDSNYRRDQFLLKEAKKNENGFIPISVLMTFKKLKAITEDASIIREAMSDSNVVELNEAGDQIKRKFPLPETDDHAERTILFVGLGSKIPSIEEVQDTLQNISVKATFIKRCISEFKFHKNGMLQIEFQTKEQVEHVEKNLDSIAFFNHKPQIMRLCDYEKLNESEKTEFKKCIMAMLVTKDVEADNGADICKKLKALRNETRLTYRVRYTEKSKEVYIYLSHVDFAEKLLELLKTTKEIRINDTAVDFELITDKKRIASRPKSEKSKSDKSFSDLRKRKYESEAKEILISNIAAEVTQTDIEKLIASVADEKEFHIVNFDASSGEAKLDLKNAANACQLHEKLCSLDSASIELCGKKLQFAIADQDSRPKINMQGCIVKIEGIKTGNISREAIAASIRKKIEETEAISNGKLNFIFYDRTETEGYMRFDSNETAAAIAKVIVTEGIQATEEVTLTQARVLEGEELEAYRRKDNARCAHRQNKKPKLWGRKDHSRMKRR